MNPENATWFNIFTLCKWFAFSLYFFSRESLFCDTVFEVVSAYGTVGLSMGSPFVRLPPPRPQGFRRLFTDTITSHQTNYSLSGSLRPFSKLIICLVMLRGRHRGLPVAIDRAVMLPSEFQSNQDTPNNEIQSEEGNGNVEEHELQEVGPRDIDPLPGSGGGEEKAGGGEQVGNGLDTLVGGNVEKEREDQNHERTRNMVAPVRDAGDGEEFELSQRYGLGEVV